MACGLLITYSTWLSDCDADEQYRICTMGRGVATFVKTACVLTNGCPENRIDTAGMQEFLKSKGWSITNKVSDADLVLFNACGLTVENAESSIRLIKHLKSQKNGSRFIVCGCLPRINPESIRSVHNDVMFGSDNMNALAALIDAEESPGCDLANFLLPSYNITPGLGWIIKHVKANLNLYFVLSKLLERKYKEYYDMINIVSPNTHYIKVSTGCVSSCSYCAVKISRGTLRSKPIEKVVAEFKAGLEQGYKKFALIGTDVGCYGRDQKTNLVQLLDELVALPGNFEIRIRNFHPRFLIEMLPDVVKVCRSGKVGFLGLAAQSGNNRILQLMRRGYSIEEYKHAFNALRKEFPHIKVRTQLMVGFPGETEREFEDTLQLIDEVDFDFIELFMFSTRLGTRANSLPGALPREVIQKRYYRILRKTLQNLSHKYPRPVFTPKPVFEGAQKSGVLVGKV